MEFPSSDKVATFTKKPKIEEGYYVGQLIEVKPRQNKDGTPVEGKFGRQIICLYQVYKKDGDKVGEPIEIKNDNGSEHLVLARVLNSEYKDTDKEGNVTYRTAFTPNATITKDFMALGWAGPPEKVNTDDYINNFVKLNVDNVDFEWKNEKGETEKYKASAIKDVGKWEGEVPSSDSPKAKTGPKTVKKQVKNADLKKEEAEEEKESQAPANNVKEQTLNMIKMLEDGNVTPEGYSQALEQLRKTDKAAVEEALAETKKDEDSSE